MLGLFVDWCAVCFLVMGFAFPCGFRMRLGLWFGCFSGFLGFDFRGDLMVGLYCDCAAGFGVGLSITCCYGCQIFGLLVLAFCAMVGDCDSGFGWLVGDW